MYNDITESVFISEISFPKSSRRETKVPLKYRMDADFSTASKVNSSSTSGPKITKPETATDSKSVTEIDMR